MKKLVLNILVAALLAVEISGCGGSHKIPPVLLDEIDLHAITLTTDLPDIPIEFFLPYVLNVKTDRGKVGLRGNVKSIEYKNGSRRILFDEKGRFIEIRVIEPDNFSHLSDPILFTYNKRGQLSHISFGFRGQFEYDNNGRIKDAVYSETGIVLEHRPFKYNLDGTIASFRFASWYSQGDRVLHYNPDGTCAKVTFSEEFYDDGEYDCVFEYTYNSNRDIETEKGSVISPHGNTENAANYDRRFTYEYDAHSNWTKKTVTEIKNSYVRSRKTESRSSYEETRKIEYY